MGNVIPWSQIHPSITSQEPFVAVVIIDPQRQICVSEMVPFDQETLADPDVSAAEVIAAAQAAAAKVAGGYRTRRKQAPADPRSRKPGREHTKSSTLTLPLELNSVPPGGETRTRSGLRVLPGGKR